MYDTLSETEEEIAKNIVDIAIKVHRALGPGLLESVYAKCFYHELQLREISFVKEKLVALFYEDLKIDEGLKLDLLIDDLVIVEFKAQEISHPVWKAQLLSYMKLSKKRLGFLINFHVPLMKDGIKRIIH